MARNFVQPGETLTFTAPYDVASGAGFLVGVVFAVALNAALSGKTVEGNRVGVWTLAKATGEAWTDKTTKLYWDNTAKKVTSTSTSNTLIGVAAAGAASGDTSGKVLLNGTIA
jgi:predicted RecA/RadA family phage recombinase